MPAVCNSHWLICQTYSKFTSDMPGLSFHCNSHPLICRVNRLLHCGLPLLTTRSQNQTHQVLQVPGLQRSSIHEKTQPESSAKLFIETCWLNDWNSESMSTWNT